MASAATSDVARVVERVEDPEDVHARVGGVPDERPDDLVAVVPVAHEVLTPQQHLERGAPAVVLDGAQPLPRVLVEEAQAGVEGGPAPASSEWKPTRVHRAQDRHDVADAHAGRPQ